MKNSQSKVLAIVLLTASMSSIYGMQGSKAPVSQCSGGSCAKKQVSGRYGRILAITKKNTAEPKAPAQVAKEGQE